MGQKLSQLSWFMHGRSHWTKSGFRKHCPSGWPEGTPPSSLTSLNFVVTGANSGIGLEVTKWLVARGARVFMVCRSRERAEKAAAEVRALPPFNPSTAPGEVQVVLGDVSLSSDCDALTASIASSLNSRKLDGILLNAGALLHNRTTTCEGVETTFAAHVVNGVWRLAHTLGALSSTAGRVVVVTSGGAYLASNDDAVVGLGASVASASVAVDALMTAVKPSEAATAAASKGLGEASKGVYDGQTAYCRAKRAQIACVRSWAGGKGSGGGGGGDRSAGGRVPFAVSVHPGWASTPGVTSSIPDFEKRMGSEMRSVTEGAVGVLWCLTAPLPSLQRGALYLDGNVVDTDGLFAMQPKGVVRSGVVESAVASVACALRPMGAL